MIDFDDYLLNHRGDENSPGWGSEGITVDTGVGLDASFPDPDPGKRG